MPRARGKERGILTAPSRVLILGGDSGGEIAWVVINDKQCVSTCQLCMVRLVKKVTRS